jgi:dGTPase
MTVRPHTVRQWLETREESLSPFAARSRSSRGRVRPEPSSPLRTHFQRDRDRIIHSKSFRRLKHKTQVFIAPLGDHFVTRLTHTLEVAQVARTISRALNLNEDLSEAIALGHDLGHTPFGHAGEEALAGLVPGGFRHSEQSLRVAGVLEHEGRGLNLTWETLDGIARHSKEREGLEVSAAGDPGTLEGCVCRLADSVAYINHDIDDAIRAGMIAVGDLPEGAVSALGRTHGQRLDTLITDIVVYSWSARGERGEPPRVGMSEEALQAANELRDFLFERVYCSADALAQAERAKETVRRLYAHMLDHPEALPEAPFSRGDDTCRRAADYIAGMTDGFALRLAAELDLLPARFGP